MWFYRHEVSAIAPVEFTVRFTIMMEDRIRFYFDKKINGYVVTLPNFVTLEVIEEWKNKFEKELRSNQNSNHFALLFDTNKHNFESIECLKRLREFLDDNLFVKSFITRAALVAPSKFMIPMIKSETEAYFDNNEKAYQWLEKQQNSRTSQCT